MRTAVIGSALFVGTAMFLVPVAQACWAAPPAVVWSKTTDGRFAIERRNKEATIVIHPAGKRRVTLWSAKLEGFNSLFSEIYVINEGTRIVHVRGNHLVGSVDSLAVVIIEKDGKVTNIAAKEFVRQLAAPTAGRRVSTDPGARWLGRIGTITDATLDIETVDGAMKVIDLTTGEVKAKKV